MASKFPVISDSGQEYRVSVHEAVNLKQYVVKVYIQKKLFGKMSYWWFVSGGAWEGRYNMNKWDYDLVEVAKHAVKKYEDSIINNQMHKKRAKESFSEFEQWDGK